MSFPISRSLSSSPLWRHWTTLLVTCVATFLVPLDVTIIAVALSDIGHDLHSSFTQLQWIVNTYNIAYTTVLMAAGTLADRFGRRKVFVLGLVFFAITSLLCGLASNAPLLILARAIQGIGAGIMLITAVAILSHQYQGAERAAAFGIWGVFIGIGAAFGPMIGGFLVDQFSWRWIFLLNVPIVIGLIALTWLKVEESRDPKAERIDHLGLTTFTGALLLVSFAIIQGNDLGWDSTLIRQSFISAAALLLAFIVVELRHARPMFDLSLFTIPTFTGASMLGIANSMSYWAMIIYLPPYFQNVLGLSTFQAGLSLLPLTLPMLLLPPVGAKLATKLPLRVFLAGGLAMIGIGFWLMHGLTAQSGWGGLFPGFLIAGIGAGLINAEMSNVAIAVVPFERSGMASGINMMFRHGSFTLGIAVMGALLAHDIQGSIRNSEIVDAEGIDLNQIANQLAIGDITSAVRLVPAALQSSFTNIANASFLHGLNFIILVAALIAFVGAVITFVTIRRQDLKVLSPSQPVL